MLSKRGSIFPTELICIILSDVAACFPERDQYEPAQDGPIRSYTSLEAEYKSCFASCRLVCHTWNSLCQPYLHRVAAIRCCSYVKKRFTYSVSLQEVLDLIDSKPHLLKYVQHLRLLPPHRHTQLRDLLLLPQILHRFTKLRIVELVNLDFTAESIQKHLCDPDSINQSYSFTPLKLDYFAFYATPERLLPINAVLFLLSLISHARSILIHTDPKVTWSVYDKFGRPQMAHWDNVQLPIIPHRTSILKTSSLSIKSRNLPQEIVQYLVWSKVFLTRNVHDLYLQPDSTRLRNLSTVLRTLHPCLLELTLDLSYFLDASQGGMSRSVLFAHTWTQLLTSTSIAAITATPLSLRDFQCLRSLTLKIPLVTDLTRQIFVDCLEVTINELERMQSLRSLLLVVVDLEYARSSGNKHSRSLNATSRAVKLLASVNALAANTAQLKSLEFWGLAFEDHFGKRFQLSEDQRTFVRQRLPMLCESGVSMIF